jgi:hypothetical protein
LKIVAAISPLLFARQDAAYRRDAGDGDRCDAMVITNGSFRLMADWVAGPVADILLRGLGRPLAAGGSVDEVAEEAHLSPGTCSPRSSASPRRDSRQARLRELADSVAGPGGGRHR